VKRVRTCSALIAVFLFSAPPVVASSAPPIIQTVEEHRNDIGEIEKRKADFRHRSAGFLFPLQLGAMPARKTFTYGPGDAEVYYTLYGGGNGDAWLSLYVYPATIGLEDEAKNVDVALLQRFEAKPITPPHGLNSGPIASIDRWFRGTVQGEDCLTGYRVVQSGRWFIKSRMSVPIRGGDEALKRGVDAMNAISWFWTEPTRPRAQSARA